MVYIIFYLLYTQFQKHPNQVLLLVWVQFLSKYEAEPDWALYRWELRALPTKKDKKIQVITFNATNQHLSLFSLSLSLAGSLSHTYKNTQAHFFLKKYFCIMD